MTSKKTRALILVGILVVIGAVVGVSVTRDSRSKVAVQTDQVARRDLVSIVSASGEVRPKRYVDVGANVSGRIEQLHVREGDTVRQGQVLARIDSTRIEAGLQQAQAALEAARAELDRARADLELSRLAFDRTGQMHEQELISDQAFDQAQAEQRMKAAAVETQERRIAQQEAAVAQLRDDLEKTTVIAPMDGVVTSLQKEEGEMAIGAQSFQPTVILTVGDLSVMEAEILIDETDIRDVALGQEATVLVDALRDVEIRGTVTEIGSSAIVRGSTGAASAGGTATNQAKDFKVVVTLEDPPPTLRPGLNATADVVTARREGVLAVPIQAVVVRQVDEEGKVIEARTSEESDAEDLAARSRGEEKEGVFVVKEGLAHFQPVETGILGETDIEILSGVEEGQEVVSGSYRTLRTLKNEARLEIDRGDDAD